MAMNFVKKRIVRIVLPCGNLFTASFVGGVALEVVCDGIITQHTKQS